MEPQEFVGDDQRGCYFAIWGSIGPPRTPGSCTITSSPTNPFVGESSPPAGHSRRGPRTRQEPRNGSGAQRAGHLDHWRGHVHEVAVEGAGTSERVEPDAAWAEYSATLNGSGGPKSAGSL